MVAIRSSQENINFLAPGQKLPGLKTDISDGKFNISRTFSAGGNRSLADFQRGQHEKLSVVRFVVTNAGRYVPMLVCLTYLRFYVVSEPIHWPSVIKSLSFFRIDTVYFCTECNDRICKIYLLRTALNAASAAYAHMLVSTVSCIIILKLYCIVLKRIICSGNFAQYFRLRSWKSPGNWRTRFDATLAFAAVL